MCQGGNIFGQHPAFLGLAAAIYLDKYWHNFSDFSAAAVNLVGKTSRVNRLDEVKQPDCFLNLIFLELSNKMPFCLLANNLMRLFGFLNVVLTDDFCPGPYRFQHLRRGVSLGGGDEGHAGRQFTKQSLYVLSNHLWVITVGSGLIVKMAYSLAARQIILLVSTSGQVGWTCHIALRATIINDKAGEKMNMKHSSGSKQTPEISLSVELVACEPGLRLKNPVMTASGTFGYGTEYPHPFDIQELGAIVCKGTTLKPRDGNPLPRVAETPAGMLNAIGLQNIGLDALLRDKASVWAGWRVPVIVNITGETEAEYAEVASKLEGVKGISAIEINISCPNIKAGGAEFGAEPAPAARVVKAVRSVTGLPLLVKLMPNTGNIVKVAEAVESAGADALTVSNTLKGMVVDIDRRCPVLGNLSGGLSGPAIRPVALYLVWQVAGAVGLPVIGCGGIGTARDALEFLMAGARAVQVGTANLTNPEAPMEVLRGIESFLEKEGIKDIKEIIGAARC